MEVDDEDDLAGALIAHFDSMWHISQTSSSALCPHVMRLRGSPFVPWDGVEACNA